MKKLFQKNPIIFILSVLVVVQSFILLRAYPPKKTNSIVSSQKTISSESTQSIRNFSFTVRGTKYDCAAINEKDNQDIIAYSNLIKRIRDISNQSSKDWEEKINTCGTEKEYESSSPEMQKIWEKYPDIKADYEEYQRTKTYTINDFQECKKYWEEAKNKSNTEFLSEINKWENEIEKLLSKNNCLVTRQTTNQNKTDINQYYQVYNDPYVLYLRKALNAYLADTINEVNVAEEAINKDKENGLITGLDSFDKSYYRSKFVVFTINNNLAGGKDIEIVFQEKPDRIFYAWVYQLADGNYELRGFNSKENIDKEQMSKILEGYKDLILDKEHSL